jgi:outer membrane protein OmpA-like peptidoglycan-associated protein
VYDYLIEKKVEASRLTYKGYGNWQMRYPKARSNRDQELNRRVEIRVLETGEKLGKIGKDGY